MASALHEFTRSRQRGCPLVTTPSLRATQALAAAHFTPSSAAEAMRHLEDYDGVSLVVVDVSTSFV